MLKNRVTPGGYLRGRGWGGRATKQKKLINRNILSHHRYHLSLLAGKCLDELAPAHDPCGRAWALADCNSGAKFWAQGGRFLWLCVRSHHGSHTTVSNCWSAPRRSHL